MRTLNACLAAGDLRHPVVLLLICFGLAFLVSPLQAAEGDGKPSADDYTLLDGIPDALYRCAQLKEPALDSASLPALRDALRREIACVIDVGEMLSQTFYPPGAFGPEGFTGRMAELSTPLAEIYRVMQTEAAACVPACGTIYTVQTLEGQLRMVLFIVTDMVDRLKDDSPVHLR
ncbi:MAG: hypothetical protein ACPGOY_12215 [Rhodospirillaceae bacterium]